MCPRMYSSCLFYLNLFLLPFSLELTPLASLLQLACARRTNGIEAPLIMTSSFHPRHDGNMSWVGAADNREQPAPHAASPRVRQRTRVPKQRRPKAASAQSSGGPKKRRPVSWLRSSSRGEDDVVVNKLLKGQNTLQVFRGLSQALRSVLDAAGWGQCRRI